MRKSFLKMTVLWNVVPCSQVRIYTDVSEKLTASIIRVMMVSAIIKLHHANYQTVSIRLHGATSHVTIIFILLAVRTRKFTEIFVTTLSN
jgi:hypothetical protein